MNFLPPNPPKGGLVPGFNTNLLSIREQTPLWGGRGAKIKMRYGQDGVLAGG